MKKKGTVETKYTVAGSSIDGGSCKCLMSTAVLQEFISVLSMVIEVEEGNEDMISCYNHVGFLLDGGMLQGSMTLYFDGSCQNK